MAGTVVSSAGAIAGRSVAFTAFSAVVGTVASLRAVVVVVTEATAGVTVCTLVA